MNNQLIVAISREFASGGREIAKTLAERLEIAYYDRNLLDEIAAENDDIIVGKVNVDEEQELAMQFSIMSIPTLLVFKNGELAAQQVGAVPKEAILSMVK